MQRTGQNKTMPWEMVCLSSLAVLRHERDHEIRRIPGRDDTSVGAGTRKTHRQMMATIGPAPICTRSVTTIHDALLEPAQAIGATVKMVADQTACEMMTGNSRPRHQYASPRGAQPEKDVGNTEARRLRPRSQHERDG